MQLSLELICGLMLAVGTPSNAASASVVDGDACRRISSPGAAARCAVRRSPVLEAAASDLDAARARRERAKIVLPSNPTVDLLVAGRRGPTDRDVNVYGTLRQEVEIGGQRRGRVRVADAELEQGRAEAATERRKVAAAAVDVYYQVLVAQRRADELTHALDVARALERLAGERADAGVTAGLERDLARAARIVVERRVLDTRREHDRARVHLAAAMGSPATDIVITGSLSPPALNPAAQQRPELASASARVRAQDRRTAVLRRERLPNPAFIAVLQRDGFGELVAGGGVSMGIPLPSPLGHTAKAEIAHSRALVRRLRADEALTKRRIAVEVESASSDLAGRRETVALYDLEATTSARASLDALAEAMAAGQLDLRSALMAQQTLLELLQGQLEAEYELCISTVTAAVASGADIEGWR